MHLEKVIVNPERLRILQHLGLHPASAPADIGAALPDIPLTTLYRHLKLLQAHGVITVVKETQIRGTVEKRYSVASDVPGTDPQKLIGATLFSLAADFSRYFEDRSMTDAQEDMLLCTTASLLLTDEEYTTLLQSVSAALAAVITNEPAPGRKRRQLTLVSSPTDGESKQ